MCGAMAPQEPPSVHNWAQGLIVLSLYSILLSTWPALSPDAVSAFLLLSFRGTSLDRLTT